MGDLGDIFDLFSQDDDNGKKQRNAQDPDSKDQPGATDTRTQITNKLKKNKMLLMATVGVIILVVGAIAYLLIGYLSDHGLKTIIDIIIPFIK
jgi:hypothetical protein